MEKDFRLASELESKDSQDESAFSLTEIAEGGRDSPWGAFRIWVVLADLPPQCRVEVGGSVCRVADKGEHERVLHLLGYQPIRFLRHMGSNVDSILAVEQWTSSLTSQGCWRGHGVRPSPRWRVLLKDRGEGLLLEAILVLLYNQSDSCVIILGGQSNTFLVGVGLRQGRPMSPAFCLWFWWTSRCSWGGSRTSESPVTFSKHCEWEAVGMRVNNTKSSVWTQPCSEKYLELFPKSPCSNQPQFHLGVKL